MISCAWSIDCSCVGDILDGYFYMCFMQGWAGARNAIDIGGMVFWEVFFWRGGGGDNGAWTTVLFPFFL